MSPQQTVKPDEVRFAPVRAGELEQLHALRLTALEPGLEGLDEPEALRSREHFMASFDARRTHHVIVAGVRVGFIAMKREGSALVLDHLFIHPDHQGRGIGTLVLAQVLREADADGLEVRVGVLRGSAFNRFYQRHGFVLVAKTALDNHYVRAAAAVSTEPTVVAAPPKEPNG